MARLADYMTAKATLPKDGTAGALAGRVWLPEAEGPAVVAVRADGVYDISKLAPTMRDLGEAPDAAALVREGKGQRIGALEEILANTPPGQRDAAQALAARAHRPAGDQGGGRHLSPVDAGAGDRGAGARRAGEGGGDPRQRRSASSAAISPSSFPAAGRRPSSSAC